VLLVPSRNWVYFQSEKLHAAKFLVYKKFIRSGEICSLKFYAEETMVPAKILVVDDEVELQRLIKQRFRKRIQANELQFIFASNGIEALDKLQKDGQIDMVLTWEGDKELIK
jgi:PleD family two-component response regulator